MTPLTETWYALVYIETHENRQLPEKDENRFAYRSRTIAISTEEQKIIELAQSVEVKLGHPYEPLPADYVTEHLEELANREFFIVTSYDLPKDGVNSYEERGRVLDSANFRLRI